jgi:hypothetical protein
LRVLLIKTWNTKQEAVIGESSALLPLAVMLFGKQAWNPTIDDAAPLAVIVAAGATKFDRVPAQNDASGERIPWRLLGVPRSMSIDRAPERRRSDIAGAVVTMHSPAIEAISVDVMRAMMRPNDNETKLRSGKAKGEPCPLVTRDGARRQAETPDKYDRLKTLELRSPLPRDRCVLRAGAPTRLRRAFDVAGRAARLQKKIPIR